MLNTEKNNDLNKIINDFKFYCIHLGLSDYSINNLIRYCKNLVLFLVEQNIFSFRQIEYKQLVNFSISGNATPSTVKARIWTLKKLFSFLLLYDHIKTNITLNLNLPKIPKKETRFLSENELKTVYTYLIKNINKSNGFRDLIIISLMAVIGLRKSSVILLDIEDYEQKYHRLFISEKGRDNKRPMQLPLALSDLIQEYILHLKIKNGPLFLSEKNLRLKSDSINRIVNKIKNNLLNDEQLFAIKLHPHIFRHSAATQINEIAGFTITKELLGHKNVENTRKYIHLSPTSYGDYMKRHPYFLTKEI
jgi:integrase/recombinase XerD